MITRRGALALALAGCARPAELQGGWVGASHERGHRLRKSGSLPAAAVQRRAQVLVVGAGIAGLAAARAFAQRGASDVHLLELEDHPGGNSRGHVLAGQRCPLGAHYLPLPGEPAREVREWLFEIGLLRRELGRTVADERHLCHSPQSASSSTAPGPKACCRRPKARRWRRRSASRRAWPTCSAWALRCRRGARRSRPCTPRWTRRRSKPGWPPKASPTRACAGTWTYCCRDDYGAGSAVVSAWAGLHYFASRHGFHAPGDEAGEREPVFTWPEGNAWLAQRLAAPFADRLHTGRTVLRVDEGRHDVAVLAWDEAAGRAEAWTAGTVVLAVPLFVAARLLPNPPDALRTAAAAQPHAPWLVANLHLDRPLTDRPGAPPSWDNVAFGSAGLGYVDAGHQRLDPSPGPVVLTAYHALPAAERPALLADDWRPWARARRRRPGRHAPPTCRAAAPRRPHALRPCDGGAGARHARQRGAGRAARAPRRPRALRACRPRGLQRLRGSLHRGHGRRRLIVWAP